MKKEIDIPSDGFVDHGVASPFSNHRGIVATVDGANRNVVLVWLFDHRGGYALLMIDASTGGAEEFPIPFPPGGDCPYSSLLSGRNRFYTHFNSHFTEFDPVKRAFTFVHSTAPQMAMGMTEDDQGRIWSVTYPDSGVVSYDPATAEFKNYGPVYNQNWKQYQRSVAADDTGWIYFAIGNTASQIIAFNPEDGAATPILPDSERTTGTAFVFRDLNGKVYGQPLQGADSGWYELYQGRAIVFEENTKEKFDLTVAYQQGQRKFLRSVDGTVYLLFRQAIMSVNQSTHRLELVAKSPVAIQFGGDILDGRIYFANASHLFSYGPL